MIRTGFRHGAQYRAMPLRPSWCARGLCAGPHGATMLQQALRIKVRMRARPGKRDMRRAVSRRELIGAAARNAAVAGLLSSSGLELRAVPLGIPIGSQTYPHRQRIKDGDFAGLCKDMADLGVGDLELCSPGYAEFAGLSDARQTRRILDDHGLRCSSGHFEMSELRTRQPETIAWAKEIGLTQMGTSSLGAPMGHGAATMAGMDSGVVSMDVVKRAADEYNRISEAAARAGIQQFLHDERFELSRVDGRLTYEVLLEVLDPTLVKMQFQMSAMTTVGDPVMYFHKYPGGFLSLHLQGVDLKAGGAGAPPASKAPAGAGQAGRRGGMPQLAVGKDSVDWVKVFSAAKTGGVKNYFIEQNWDLTVQSVAYLKTLNV
jgi:sugar phosphate isomerase/epimerase